MKNIQGVYTVLITPFDDEDNLDEEGLHHNIRYQIENGVDGIVALGTTGEDPTLSDNERSRIIQIARKETSGRLPLMVGTGSYSTARTIQNSLNAQNLGADYLLIVTPYYNRPTQQGIFEHYKAIAEKVSTPILLYNIQGRCGQNIETDTLLRIAELPNIIGVKEASGNISQFNSVMEKVSRKHPHFKVMCGDDALTLSLMALGGHGILSVASNLVPDQIKALTTALQNGDYDKARDIHFRLLPLFQSLFIETNPMPIKCAMHMCGMPAGKCRLPLCCLQPENKRILRQVLQKYDLIPTTCCAHG